MIVQIATKCSENFLTNFECVWSIFFIRNLDLKSSNEFSSVQSSIDNEFLQKSTICRFEWDRLFMHFYRLFFIGFNGFYRLPSARWVVTQPTIKLIRSTAFNRRPSASGLQQVAFKQPDNKRPVRTLFRRSWHILLICLEYTLRTLPSCIKQLH